MIVWISALIAIIYVALTVIKWRKGRHLNKLPTWTYLPILGNLHYLTGSQEHLYRCLVQVSDVMEKSGLPFVFWVGTYPFLVTSNPEDARTVANACIEKPHYYRFSQEWVGDGLITAPGHIWKKNIKVIAGAFTRPMVNNYQAIFNEQARKLAEMMMKKANCGPFDVKRFIALRTLDAICQTAFGIEEISKTISTEDYYNTYIETLGKILERALNVLHHPQFIYNWTRSYKEYMEHVAKLQNVSGEVLKKLKLSRDESKSNNSNDVSPSTVNSFLSFLLNMSKYNADMTEDYIKSEVNTIILAGQETVAVAMHYILTMIGGKREVQEKVYSEIKGICGEKRDITPEDLERMVYCEGVICETLRLYPPVPIVLRKVDTDLQLMDCQIQKGMFCAFNVYASGRSRRLWGEDVLEYRPERWREPTPQLLAFSIGKRACVGRRYTIQILKTMMAYCIRDLEFKSKPEELQFKLDINLRAWAGDLIEVELRNKK